MNDKPTILLLSDDFDAPSGIGTQSRTFIENTLNEFNWVQIGAATEHPDDGKRQDLSERFQNDTGIGDAYVVKYPSTGYGDSNKLRRVLKEEDIDGILHFTDPRFWDWLYQMEYEIHQEYRIPLMYYAIWDNFPYPYWNVGSYSSCDLIMGISKQSHLIHNVVLNQNNIKTHDLSKDFNADDVKPGDVLTKYVPHGVDPNKYYPIVETTEEGVKFQEFSENFKKAKSNAEFIFYWSNRNIGRKLPSQLIVAFDQFRKKLSKKDRSKVALVMHTTPVDPNGTDLQAVRQHLAPDSNIVFIPDKLNIQVMNFLYNMADVTINVANNEGFGLSSLESLAAGTPVISNVTGGLQDQMRFQDQDGNWFEPSMDIPSNHTATFQECGEWAYPIYPASRALKGSVTTPYIFDDNPNIEDIRDTLLQAWKDRKKLPEKGEAGRKWILGEESGMSANELGKSMTQAINACLDAFQVGMRYEINKHEIINYTETGIL